MNEETELDLSTWLSTYGILTSQRILERFNIHLANEELISAIKNPRSVYYLLLRVPLKNVFNGIILQQAHDYQVYAQKIFIDYLLSGESGKDEASPGANTRDQLEQERTKLMQIGEEFNKLELEHQTIISESQTSLINLANELKKSLQEAAKKIGLILKSHQILKDESFIFQAFRVAMTDYEKIDDETLAVSSNFWLKMSSALDIDLNNDASQQMAKALSPFSDPRHGLEQILSSYLEQTANMSIEARSFRSQFYDTILRATDLINLLPDYRVNKEKEEENRSSLHFDSHIGGE